MNVTIINAYGHSNSGDSVLLDECVNEINEIFDNDVKISVCLFDAERFEMNGSILKLERLGNIGSESSIPLIKKIFIASLLVLYCISGLKFFLRFLSGSQKKTVSFLSDADRIISAPGGYIHDTNFAYILALVNIWVSCKLCNEVILAPQSIGPIDNYFSRLFLKFVLNKSKAICVRESYSMKFISRCGVSKPAIFSCVDSAFWNSNVDYTHLLDDSKVIGIIDDERFLGITVVDWTFPGRNNVDLLKSDYINAIQQISVFVYKTFGMRTVIFNQVQDDLSITNEIVKNYEDIFLVDRIVKHSSRLRALISKSTAFVGTRFHSCIFALTAGVPTQTISYLPKTTYIMDDIGLLERSHSIDNILIDRIIKKISIDILEREVCSINILAALESYKQNTKSIRDCF